jgi:hypothetical protein
MTFVWDFCDRLGILFEFLGITGKITLISHRGSLMSGKLAPFFKSAISMSMVVAISAFFNHGFFPDT